MSSQSAGLTYSVTSIGGELVLDAYNARAFRIFLNEDITTMSIVNPADGKHLVLIFRQEGDSDFSVTYPSNVVGGIQPTTGELVTTVVPLFYDAGDATWYVTSGSGSGPSPTAPTIVALTPTIGGNFTVAHGLSATPTYAVIQMTSDGEIWFQTPQYDGTNLYLTASDGEITGNALVFA